VTRLYIQAAVFPDGNNTQRLMYLAEEMGLTVHVEPYVPFGGMSYDFLPDDGPVVFYGSVALLRDAMRRRLPHAPLCWFDAGALRCVSYYARWGRHLLQREYGMYPLGDLPRLRAFLYATYGEDDAVFLRPDENDKEFTGEVVAAGAFDRWWAVANMAAPPPSLLCVVARPVPIEAEWRLIIADGKVVTGSQYRRRGSLCIEAGFPDEAAALAEAAAAEWSPHPVYSLDVAATPDGPRIIELGSINCSGLYACDLRQVVAAIAAAAERDWVRARAGGPASGP
jgi:hypothetical protein